MSEVSVVDMDNNILVIGPQPPAIGGIATIVSLIRRDFSHFQNVSFIDSSKPKTVMKRALLPLSVLFKIVMHCVLNKKCNVLLFSSAHKSFFEKMLWVALISLCGSRAFVVMVDGNYPDFYSALPRIWKRLSRFFMKRAVVVGQSSTWGEYYKSIFPQSEVKLITGGVDVDFFTPTDKKKIDDSTVTILYVGWIMAAKGIYDLLAAVRDLLPGANKKIILELVGPIYEDADKLNAAIDSGDLREHVKLCGPVLSREILREKYQNADIFAFPSHFEGFPVALLEALSSGLACVGTKAGGIPDILDHGRVGLVVNKESPSELASALLSLINDQTLRTDLRLKARERAVHNYTLQDSMSSYKKLLGLEK